MTCQLYITLRIGELRTREIDCTSGVCFVLIAALVYLVGKTTMV
jgi:hypothetical protein